MSLLLSTAPFRSDYRSPVEDVLSTSGSGDHREADDDVLSDVHSSLSQQLYGDYFGINRNGNPDVREDSLALTDPDIDDALSTDLSKEDSFLDQESWKKQVRFNPAVAVAQTSLSEATASPWYSHSSRPPPVEKVSPLSLTSVMSGTPTLRPWAAPSVDLGSSSLTSLSTGLQQMHLDEVMPRALPPQLSLGGHNFDNPLAREGYSGGRAPEWSEVDVWEDFSISSQPSLTSPPLPREYFGKPQCTIRIPANSTSPISICPALSAIRGEKHRLEDAEEATCVATRCFLPTSTNAVPPTGLTAPQLHTTQKLQDKLLSTESRMIQLSAPGAPVQSEFIESARERIAKDANLRQNVVERAATRAVVLAQHDGCAPLPASLGEPPPAIYDDLLNLSFSSGSVSDLVREQARRAAQVRKEAQQVAASARKKEVFPEPQLLDWFETRFVVESANLELRDLPPVLPQLRPPLKTRMAYHERAFF